MSHSRTIIGALLLWAVPATAQTTEPAPTDLWAAQTALNMITLVWKPVAGATGYVLWRDVGASAAATGQGAQRQAKLATLASNANRYGYVVRNMAEAQQFYLEAIGANGKSSARVPFNPVTMVNAAVPAVPPPSVTATESTPGVITLTWAPSPGATAYMLGRVVGGSGLAMLCSVCPTTGTYVDSGVATGVRYQYAVTAITPTAVSQRTMSNPLTPGVVASGATGAVGSGTTSTGGATTTSGTGATGVIATTGGTATTSGTSGTTSDTTQATTLTPVAKTPSSADPSSGRYRITLTNFTVNAQTYDNPFQLDGKGDEVYLATHILLFDTSSTNLVVSNEVRTSKMYGDVSGFSYRVRAGTAGSTGGLATGNSVGAATTPGGEFPMVLWEGPLVQGKNVLVVIPTIWEWDDNPELFGNWLTGRHAMLDRLLQAEPLAALLLNTDLQPVELGAGGLYVRTNMFGDARDRPIGLRPGQPVSTSGFMAPLSNDATGTYANMTGSVVQNILQNSPFATIAKAVLDRIFQSVSGFATAVGNTLSRIQLAAGAVVGNVASQVVGTVRPRLSTAMRAQESQGATGLRQFATLIQSAAPSSFASDMYFFEKAVAITPAAMQTALAGAKYPWIMVDVPYVDYTALQGKYTLYLKVEKLP